MSSEWLGSAEEWQRGQWPTRTNNTGRQLLATGGSHSAVSIQQVCGMERHCPHH